MALDFPASPTAGQTYVGTNGVTYQWNATYTAWIPITGPFAAPVDFNCIFTGNVGFTSTPATVTAWNVTSGNAGGWYNPANGRFTPPPGRYHIFCGFDAGNSGSATGLYIYLRKNGTTVLQSGTVTGAAGWWGECEVQGNFDCNGTDWFDVQGYAGSNSNMTGMYAWFGAFALPSGAQAASGIGSAWRQIGRIVPVAAQGPIDFVSLPSDINDLELRFDVGPTAGGQDFVIQFFGANGLIDNTSGHYPWSLLWSNHTMAAGAAAQVYSSTSATYTSGFIINGSVATARVTYPIQGRLTVNNIRDGRTGRYARWEAEFLEQSGTYWVGVKGSGARNTAEAITGVRLTWGSTTFAAGGEATLWGSP